MTKDPVCGMKVDENRGEFQTQFAGKKYFFCSDECRKEFEADPDALCGDGGGVGRRLKTSSFTNEKAPLTRGLFYWLLIHPGSARFASRDSRGGCRYMVRSDPHRQS